MHVVEVECAPPPRADVGVRTRQGARGLMKPTETKRHQYVRGEPALAYGVLHQQVRTEPVLAYGVIEMSKVNGDYLLGLRSGEGAGSQRLCFNFNELFLQKYTWLLPERIYGSPVEQFRFERTQLMQLS